MSLGALSTIYVVANELYGVHDVLYVVMHNKLCVLARLTPVAALLLVHCHNGKWPSGSGDDTASLLRVLRYGVHLHAWRERPVALLTFMFVHASNEHVLGNAAALALALLKPMLHPAHSPQRTAHNNHPRTRHAPCHDTLAKACVQTLGAMAVFMLGSWGGLAAQMVDTDRLHTQLTSTAATARECAERLWQVCLQSVYMLGCAVVDGVVRLAPHFAPHAAHVKDALPRSHTFTSAAAPAPAAYASGPSALLPLLTSVSASLLQGLQRVCRLLWAPTYVAVGASAGVYALMAFDATYRQCPAAAAASLLHAACLCAMQHVYSVGVGAGSTCAPSAPSSPRLWPPLSVLLPGTWDGGGGGSSVGDFLATASAAVASAVGAPPPCTIATAAHVGGLLTGAVVGLVCRWCVQASRRRRAHRQRQREQQDAFYSPQQYGRVYTQ